MTDKLPRPVLILLGCAAFVITLSGIRAFSSTIAPTFLAATLVITVNPIHRWFRKLRIPGWIGTILMLLTIYVVLIGLIASLGYAGARLATIIPKYSQEFNDWYNHANRILAGWGVGQDQINTALSQLNYGSIFNFAQSIVSQTASAGSTFIFLLTVTVFLVMDSAGVPERLAALARVKPELATSLQDFAHRIRTYWIVTTVFGLIVAVLDGLVLWWLGVPLPLTWALLSFITNYIPNVGFILGLVPPALLGVLDGGVSTGLAVIAVYAVLNVVVQTIIQPRITGDAVGINTITAFISLVLWTFILGPLGAIVAIPMTLFVKTVLLDADPNAKWVDVFLANTVEEVDEAVEA